MSSNSPTIKKKSGGLINLAEKISRQQSIKHGYCWLLLTRYSDILQKSRAVGFEKLEVWTEEKRSALKL
jgi:hypothetical protein